MANYVTASAEVDRSNSMFNISVDYFIDPYIDPETGEYFADTQWYADYHEVGGGTGTFAGWGSEFGWAFLELGLDSTPGVHQYELDFTASNTFSADSISASWNVFSAALDTAAHAIAGTAENDIILGGSGDDTLQGLAGTDHLDGGDGNDSLVGGAGIDRLVGGAGRDTLAGGADGDTYEVQDAGDVIVEAANGGIDRVETSVTYTLGANVEILVMRNVGAIGATGNAIGNRMDGNGYGNVMSGLGGRDTLLGLGGNDTLYGNQGHDYLEGGDGHDRMDGGLGNDTFLVNSHGDQVVEGEDGGADQVRVAGLASYTLGDHVENFLNAGRNGIDVTGNALGNELIGGIGRDTLDGGAGDDLADGKAGNDLLLGSAGADDLRGGEDNDTVSYAASTAAVTVNLATGYGYGGDAEGDRVRGIENAIGTAQADMLIGNFLNNRLYGGAGADTIMAGIGNDLVEGGSGADSLDGGRDLDTLSYESSVGAVTVNLVTATVSGGDAAGDTIAGFERVIGGHGNDSLTGGAGADSFTGGGGADTIVGGGNNDLIIGGAGGDALYGDGGVDTLSYRSSVGAVNINLATGGASGGDAAGDQFFDFENVEGGHGNDRLTGTSGANLLEGGGGADTIFAAAGDDRVSGGAGADSLHGGAGTDRLSYAGSSTSVTINLQNGTASGGDAQGDKFVGFEDVEGGEAGDVLYGSDGANRLDGRGGSDYLSGGGGNDTLTGGAGNNGYGFGFGFGQDVITDFRAGDSSFDYLNIFYGEDFDTVEEIMAAAHASGDSNQHTVFQFDADTTLTLLNVNINTLNAEDFFL